VGAATSLEKQHQSADHQSVSGPFTYSHLSGVVNVVRYHLPSTTRAPKHVNPRQAFSKLDNKFSRLVAGGTHRDVVRQSIGGIRSPRGRGRARVQA